MNGRPFDGAGPLPLGGAAVMLSTAVPKLYTLQLWKDRQACTITEADYMLSDYLLHLDGSLSVVRHGRILGTFAPGRWAQITSDELEPANE